MHAIVDQLPQQNTSVTRDFEFDILGGLTYTCK
jgi:hypothetical protein